MRCGVVASVLLTLCSTSLVAQVDNNGREFGLGAGISVVSNPPGWFTYAICPDKHPTAYQIAGRIRLRGPVVLKVAASRYSENPDVCLDGFIPPIPETGRYTQRGRSFDAEIKGYPYWAADVQLGADAYYQDALLGRVSLGPIWIPSKHLIGLAGSLGTGLRIPRTPLVVSLTYEQQWIGISYVDAVVEYLDGQIESFELTPKRDRISPRTLTLAIEVWR